MSFAKDGTEQGEELLNLLRKINDRLISIERGIALLFAATVFTCIFVSLILFLSMTRI